MDLHLILSHFHFCGCLSIQLSAVSAGWKDGFNWSKTGNLLPFLAAFALSSICCKTVEVKYSMIFPLMDDINKEQQNTVFSSLMTNNILSTELFMCGRGLSLQIHRTKGWEAARTLGMYPLFLVPTSWSSLHHATYIVVLENHIDSKRIRIVLDLFFNYILLPAHCPSQPHYILIYL